MTTEAEKQLMMPSEVAVMFGVDPKTVTRWARKGKLPYITTPGGHHRYRRAAMEALLRRGESPVSESA